MFVCAGFCVLLCDIHYLYRLSVFHFLFALVCVAQLERRQFVRRRIVDKCPYTGAPPLLINLRLSKRSKSARAPTLIIVSIQAGGVFDRGIARVKVVCVYLTNFPRLRCEPRHEFALN